MKAHKLCLGCGREGVHFHVSRSEGTELCPGCGREVQGFSVPHDVAACKRLHESPYTWRSPEVVR